MREIQGNSASITKEMVVQALNADNMFLDVIQRLQPNKLNALAEYLGDAVHVQDKGISDFFTLYRMLGNKEKSVNICKILMDFGETVTKDNLVKKYVANDLSPEKLKAIQKYLSTFHKQTPGGAQDERPQYKLNTHKYKELFDSLEPVETMRIVKEVIKTGGKLTPTTLMKILSDNYIFLNIVQDLPREKIQALQHYLNIEPYEAGSNAPLDKNTVLNYIKASIDAKLSKRATYFKQNDGKVGMVTADGTVTLDMDTLLQEPGKIFFMKIWDFGSDAKKATSQLRGKGSEKYRALWDKMPEADKAFLVSVNNTALLDVLSKMGNMSRYVLEGISNLERTDQEKVVKAYADMLSLDKSEAETITVTTKSNRTKKILIANRKYLEKILITEKRYLDQFYHLSPEGQRQVLAMDNVTGFFEELSNKITNCARYKEALPDTLREYFETFGLDKEVEGIEKLIKNGYTFLKDKDGKLSVAFFSKSKVDDSYVSIDSQGKQTITLPDGHSTFDYRDFTLIKEDMPYEKKYALLKSLNLETKGITLNNNEYSRIIDILKLPALQGRKNFDYKQVVQAILKEKRTVFYEVTGRDGVFANYSGNILFLDDSGNIVSRNDIFWQTKADGLKDIPYYRNILDQNRSVLQQIHTLYNGKVLNEFAAVTRDNDIYRSIHTKYAAPGRYLIPRLEHSYVFDNRTWLALEDGPQCLVNFDKNYTSRGQDELQISAIARWWGA